MYDTMPNTIKLDNCPVWKTMVDKIEYLNIYDRVRSERTPKYTISIQVDSDFFLMLKRKIVRTHTRTPVGSEPMARLEILNHSIPTPPASGRSGNLNYQLFEINNLHI